jgi:heme exporter protein D
MAFLDMGGYAAFVWPSFGLTAVVLIGLLVLSLRALRAEEAELRALQGRAPDRRADRGPSHGEERSREA